MPDLPSRAQREREAAEAILIVFRRHEEDSTLPPDFAAEIESAIAPALAATYQDAARNLARSLALPISDSDSAGLSEDADSYASQFGRALGAEIAATSADRLQIGTAPADVFSWTRAEKIAATEVTRAISAGELFILTLASLNGFGGLERVWHTERDGLVCSVCRPLHLRPETDWRSAFPAGPPAHPYCRCWLDYRQTNNP